MKKVPGYIRRGGYTLPENVPFQQILPLKLRNLVSGKGEKSSTAACVQEMSVLFACLKNNAFNEAMCHSEVDKFKKCYTEHSTMKRQKKEQERRGVLTPGEKNLSHKQANELLKKYPL